MKVLALACALVMGSLLHAQSTREMLIHLKKSLNKDKLQAGEVYYITPSQEQLDYSTVTFKRPDIYNLTSFTRPGMSVGVQSVQEERYRSERSLLWMPEPPKRGFSEVSEQVRVQESVSDDPVW